MAPEPTQALPEILSAELCYSLEWKKIKDEMLNLAKLKHQIAAAIQQSTVLISETALSLKDLSQKPPHTAIKADLVAHSYGYKKSHSEISNQGKKRGAE